MAQVNPGLGETCPPIEQNPLKRYVKLLYPWEQRKSYPGKVKAMAEFLGIAETGVSTYLTKGNITVAMASKLANALTVFISEAQSILSDLQRFIAVHDQSVKEGRAKALQALLRQRKAYNEGLLPMPPHLRNGKRPGRPKKVKIIDDIL